MNKVGMIRAATVGCGRMGAFHSLVVERYAPSFWMPISHLGAISALPGFVASACCDVNPEAVARAQALHGVDAGFVQSDEMLRQVPLDLLTIATRTPEKRALLEAAIARGLRHFHVEKPLVNSVVDLLALEDLFARTGSLMTYGAIRRYLPPYRQAAADLAAASGIGPLHIGIEMGRSPLMWTLIHGIDLILFLADNARPIWVQGWFEGVELVDGCPDHVRNDPNLLAGTILFDDGTVGHIGAAGGDGVTLAGGSRRIEILSDGHQMFEVGAEESNPYPVRRARTVPASDGPGGTAAALDLLAGALRGVLQATTVVEKSTRDVFLGMRIMFGLLASHLDGGRRVAIDALPSGLRIDGISRGAPA